MKKIAAALLSSVLTLGSIGAAQAHGGYYRDFRPPVPYYHHHDRGGWIGPAAVLAITGLAVGAAYSRSYAPQPAPVYVAPAPVYAPPAPNPNVWYFCGSSGQYYPYTNACPEGWQAVPAR